MAVTVAASGSQTATASEVTISSAQTTAGVYVLQLDMTNMAAGDVVEIYIYTKILSGSTAHLLDKVTFANAQGDPNWQSVPVVVPYSIEYKLKQPTGTGRSIDYAIVSL